MRYCKQKRKVRRKIAIKKAKLLKARQQRHLKNEKDKERKEQQNKVVSLLKSLKKWWQVPNHFKKIGKFITIPIFIIL